MRLLIFFSPAFLFMAARICMRESVYEDVKEGRANGFLMYKVIIFH